MLRVWLGLLGHGWILLLRCRKVVQISLGSRCIALLEVCRQMFALWVFEHFLERRNNFGFHQFVLVWLKIFGTLVGRMRSLFRDKRYLFIHRLVDITSASSHPTILNYLRFEANRRLFHNFTFFIFGRWFRLICDILANENVACIPEPDIGQFYGGWWGLIMLLFP